MGPHRTKSNKSKKIQGGWCNTEWEKMLSWILEVELGVIWAVSGLSLISFIFTSIWYIDPALLTMVLQFQPATCTTVKSSHLVGISNCTWTSCRHGCTSEIFKCWHILANYTLVSGSRPIPPPWASLSALDPPPTTTNLPSRLYPNVRGCGYPPKLQCEDFFSEFGVLGSSFSCWVSHMDPEIALTELDLRKLKEEVMYSLLPLGSFILSTLYALCRLGVFTICNPLRCLPRPLDTADKTRLTPKQLFRYKKALMARKGMENVSQQQENVNVNTIVEDMKAIQEDGSDSPRAKTGPLLEQQGTSLLPEQDTTKLQEQVLVERGGGEEELIDYSPDAIRADLVELSSELERLETDHPYERQQAKQQPTRKMARNKVVDIEGVKFFNN